MNGIIYLKFCFFAFGIVKHTTVSAATEKTTVEVSPQYQTTYEHNDVVIYCKDMMGSKVHWERQNGKPLPKQAMQKNGRISINNIRFEDGGYYVCYNHQKHKKAMAKVEVIRTTTLSPVFSTARMVTQGLDSFKEVNSTPYPCIYGVCNRTCCTSESTKLFFDCANGQKVEKSLVCNNKNDCDDGSDESRCSPWPPKITVLPKPEIKIYCGDEDIEKSGILILECESVGHPTPVIRWKKYDGHIPTKCHQYSKRGHGILTCPDFQQSDQGAYSCVAENYVKLAESQPKSFAKCQNKINCKGFTVVSEEQIQHCLTCYCSGKTTQCQNIKSNTSVVKLPSSDSKSEVFVKESGEIVFLPTKTVLTPNPESRLSASEITYCTWNQDNFEESNFLKSFGRSIIIPKYVGKADFLTKAPDLIIRGNEIALMYTAALIPSADNNTMGISVRFWPGNWHHLNKKPASREDLMRVLSNVEALFVRCEFQQGQSVSWSKNATIFLESSIITDYAQSESYVEKCACPVGYDGLSCESCAAGYKKKPLNKGDFICEKIYVPVPQCEKGYEGENCTSCDTLNGYYKIGNLCKKSVCHPDGSLSVFSNLSGTCSCKEGVTGSFCSECQKNYFFLHKEKGCLKCWCSGVSNQCKSSKLFRSFISNIPRGGYNSSDGRNFWLLPPNFSGNQLTSYGGYLNYTMKYKPNIAKQNTHLTVEFLSKEDITLIYTHTELDTSLIGTKKSWFIFINETNWKKSDKSSVTREEFLSVLSKIKAIYIESPYHLSSGQVTLTSARMSSATASGDSDSQLALAVEECHCPEGYTGLSCERCSEGYYKKRNGTVTQCIKCNCSYCDPEFGCPDCPQLSYRDNPEEEKIPICKPCSCNGNGISCTKDDLNQIFCRCKPGFTGMHCENRVSYRKNDLTVTISPRRIINKKAGATVNFNCSFFSDEEMILSVKINQGSHTQNSLKSSFNDLEKYTNQGTNISRNFEVTLETGLKSVECLVHDLQRRLAGRVLAVIEDLITVTKPVKITNCYSSKIDVKESETKDIICEASGSPAPLVTWYKTNGSSAEKVDTSKGVHTIESASLSDNGTIYTCVAENIEGDKATCTQVLIVRKKCEVINVIPKKIKTEEGKNVSVKCKTTAKSEVSWSVLDSISNKKKSISSSRITTNRGYLNIENTTVSDTGTYLCSAFGENGELNKTFSLVVTEKRIPPTAYIQEYDKTLALGETFNAHCIVAGNPAPVIIWKKLNGTLATNIKVNGSLLTIRDARSENSGVYECEARSSLGNVSSFISVEIETLPFIPPRINISEEVISGHENDEVTISCLAIGYPRPTLYWAVSNTTLTNVTSTTDSMVTIEPLQSIKEEVTFKIKKNMDGLVIYCLAESAAGADQKSTKIKVFQAKKGINETVEFVPIGSYFELTCDVTDEIEWEKIGGMVGDECKIPNGLMITSVQIQHNGTYICSTKSDSKKIINLIVVGFVPKFSKAFRSYLVLPVHLRSSKDIRIDMSFNPSSENGVLLQKESNKLDVYLEKKKIHLSIYSHDGDFLDIIMNKEIKLGNWYSLVISIDINYVDITIYDEFTSIYERKTERAKNFDFSMGLTRDNFFIGGPVAKVRHHKKLFLRGYAHLDGCISKLRIDRHEFDIIKESSFSQNVTLCRRCSEENNLCSEKGKCLDAPTQYGFICVCPTSLKSYEKCPASCEGKGCETQLDLCTLLNPCGEGFLHKCINRIRILQCKCAIGYSGTTCEKGHEYSFCTKGNGFVKLPSNLLRRQIGTIELIRMSFTLFHSSGQLLWQGDRSNYLSLAVQNGKLEYVYYNQHTKLAVYSARQLALHKKINLLLKRVNNSAHMEIKLADQPSFPETYQNSSLKIKTNRVIGDIYLGNVPKVSLHSEHHEHHVGLNGCIHYISFGDGPKINLPENELEKSNIFSPQIQDLEPVYGNDEYYYNNAIDSNYKNIEELNFDYS